MDLQDILSSWRKSAGSSVAMVCGYRNVAHEPVLIDMIRQCMASCDAAAGPPSGASTQLPLGTVPMQSSLAPTTASRHACLLICLQKSASVYRQLMNPLIMCRSVDNLQFSAVDIPTWLRQQVFSSGAESNSNNFAQLPHLLCKYLEDKVNEFVSSICVTGGSQPRVVIAVDNIATLVDIGITPRQLEHLISGWLQIVPLAPQISNDVEDKLITESYRLVLGCHVGVDCLSDDYLDPTLAHLIHLLRLRYSSLVIDLRPLTTGYSTELDGEMSINNLTASDPMGVTLPVMETAHQQLHYRCENRRVLCYPPGTSKLVT